MAEKKVISIEDRIPKLKEARKKKANRRLVFYLTLFFMLISIIVYLQSPLSHIKKIVVHGVHLVEEDEIINASTLTLENNIWYIDFKDIKNKIEALPEIKSVQVERKLPNTVEISVEEFLRVGYVKEDGQFFPVLENGQAIENRSVNTPVGDAPLLFGWENSTYLEEMTTELSKLHSGIAELISEIHWVPEESNPYKVRLFMIDNREVITSIRNFSDKMRAYPSISMQIDASQEGYINLDLGAFFVPYGSSEEEVNETEGENQNEGER